MDTEDPSAYKLGSRARRFLFSTFWSADGWKRAPEWPPEPHLTEAINAGVMFRDSPLRAHDEWVAEIVKQGQALSVAEIETAFVGSFGSRRLDLRSALSSFAVARVLSQHHFERTEGQNRCRVCGLPPDRSSTDRNILSFERLKWGGVRLTDLHYVHFDLDQFARAPVIAARDSDYETVVELIRVLSTADSGETSTTIERHLSFIPSNRKERLQLIDILGIAGILAPADHPGFAQAFVPLVERHVPPRHFVDRNYPVSWWKGSDGVTLDAVSLFLPRTAAR